MILLVYFIVLLIFNLVLKGRSVSIIFILLQILSLSGVFLIGRDYPIDSFFKVFNIVITAIILTLIIAPWLKTKNIHEIYFANDLKLKRVTYFLLIVSFFTFIVLLFTALYVHLTVDNINVFKENAGDFYYNILPINVKIYILSTYLYYFSYFLIPLHFYYLGKRKIRLSILCFVFSLNSILYGLTYFSRSVFVNYALLYLSFLFLLYGTFNFQTKRYIKISAIIIVVMFAAYFIDATNKRFTDNQSYESLIPASSVIQNPVLYSYLDYLSQWYHNSMTILYSYDFKTFSGQISLQPVLFLLGQYRIINYNSLDYENLRMSLWPEQWDRFNGIVAYSIYDYGYIVSIMLSLFYYYIVRKLGPKNNRISLLNLFYLVLLIQLPLMAIFYSTVGGILIPSLLLIPIYLYLRTTIKNKLPPKESPTEMMLRT